MGGGTATGFMLNRVFLAHRDRSRSLTGFEIGPPDGREKLRHRRSPQPVRRCRARRYRRMPAGERLAVLATVIAVETK
ncbi:MAG: hypothetical protein OXF07_07035 [Rhodobacter sp.]|nr:hypothetical protein [Rhodobacter sp.]MCY4168288.1 hypothetical protein [Rhodobacter sp.]MCY4243213.1 hypothetical protein [Rhodobacter sp.]